jgi:hypothetical protein
MTLTLAFRSHTPNKDNLNKQIIFFPFPKKERTSIRRRKITIKTPTQQKLVCESQFFFVYSLPLPS